GLEGVSVAALIRAVGLAGAPGRNTEAEEARRIILEAALEHLGNARENDRTGFAEVFDDLELHYRDRLADLTEEEADVHSARHRRYVELSRELLRVELQPAVRLRNEGRINDEFLREVEHELDLTEARILPGGARQ